MENLIEFQEIQNQNIEILKQQLQDLNVNNTEEEIINTKYKKNPEKVKKLYYHHLMIRLIRKIKNLLRSQKLNVNERINRKRPLLKHVRR